MSARKDTQVSPFEIAHGFPPRLAFDLDLSKTPPTNVDQLAYLDSLKKRLKLLHEGVTENNDEIKEMQARSYDTRFSVKPSPFQVGSLVWLRDDRIARDGDVICHRPYAEKYVITEAIRGDKFGEAYRLANAKTGKLIKSLVNADRLKICRGGEREKFLSRNPPLASDEIDPSQEAARKVDQDRQIVQLQSLPECFELAKRIISKKRQGR